MKFITADYIHDGKIFLPQGYCLAIEDDIIIDILKKAPNENTEHVRGLICPGLINTHCHLELSYLKNKIPQQTGILDFVLEIQKQRENYTDKEIKQSIEEAEKEMMANGIVAVGDICNTNFTIEQKKKQNLYYHNFVECVGVFDTNAKHRFDFYTELKKQFYKANLTPHAPYSVSDALFELINNESAEQIITIHNQESSAENELFEKATGNFIKLYNSLFGDEYEPKPRATTSLQYYLPLLSQSKKIILVHNTYTTKADIDFLRSYLPFRHGKQELFWCTCPNANLYIENQLPNYKLLLETNHEICIGTDSLASNTALDIWQEIETIKKHNSFLNYNTLITWATHNGAKALGIETEFGSFEIGKSAKFYNNSEFILI